MKLQGWVTLSEITLIFKMSKNELGGFLTGG